MNLLKALIHSNIYISLAAVFLAIETQIQLGMEPQAHPYLFIIFFATLFEYNLHRLVTVLTDKKALNSEKHKWVRENPKKFYLLVIISVAGFVGAIFMAKKEVLLTFALIAILTIFYSVPVYRNKNQLFRLREIPYLKIFLIASVWSASTILLPVIQAIQKFDNVQIIMLLLERFFFIFAITIPFDIRDMEADQRAGLKTIPLLLNEKKALQIAFLSLTVFFLISFFHYQFLNEWFIVWALGISTISTFLFLQLKYFRNLSYYHYGVLDGTMLLQGLLVLVFYYIQH